MKGAEMRLSILSITRFAMFLICLSTASGCFAQSTASAVASGDATHMAFNYSGALFGYYQLNAADPSFAPGPVRNLLDRLPGGSQAGNYPQYKGLLVGLGDNFGPEFTASIQPEKMSGDGSCDIKAKEPEAPRKFYKADDRYPAQNQVHCDNVARFLLSAGYRAIVPGREDFLYTATWLRAIALGLRWANNPDNFAPLRAHNAENKLTMIAANLRVKGSGGKQPQTTESTTPCPLLFAPSDQKPIVPVGCTQNALPVTAAIDWLTRLDASFPEDGDVAQSIYTESSLDLNFPRYIVDACRSGLPPAADSKCREALLKDEHLDLSPNRGDDQSRYLFRWDYADRLLDHFYRRHNERSRNPDLCRKPADKALFLWCALDAERSTILWLNARDTIHESSTLELRRTLLENQAQQMLSMLDGLDLNDRGSFSSDQAKQLREQLTNINGDLSLLTRDASYVVDENHHQTGLTLEQHACTSAASADGGKKAPCSGKGAFKGLQDDMNSFCLQQSNAAQKDLCTFGKGLVAVFSQISGRPLGEGEPDALLLNAKVRRAGRNMILRSIANEQIDTGYTIYHDCAPAAACAGKPGTLIVGIVSGDVMAAVSPTNLGTVFTLDPFRTLVAVLRAARQKAIDSPGSQFNRVVILAQMERTQAEVLGMRLRQRIAHSDMESPILDLSSTPVVILSKADDGAFSPQDLEESFGMGETIPVLTPKPPYSSGDGHLRFPLATTYLQWGPHAGSRVHLKVDLPDDSPVHEQTTAGMPETPFCPSTLTLLLKKMTDIHSYITVSSPESCGPVLEAAQKGQCLGGSANATSEKLKLDQSECERDMSAMLLDALRRKQRDELATADVAMLEQRDIFYGNLSSEYSGYRVCRGAGNQTAAGDGSLDPAPSNRDEAACQLRVALDRVLWKGDHPERVMISGSDLVSMLTTSSKEAQDEESLSPTGVYQQTLATYGIVQPASVNLSNPGTSKGFDGPQDKTCGSAKNSVTNPSAYCVNGQPIASDAAYWVITSDHLAHDNSLYKVMQATVALHYHKPVPDVFLTESIASELMHGSSPPAQLSATEIEWRQQERVIAHLDIAKMVAGFNARRPQGGNVFAENFQGATDTRASTPSLQELDLESLTRFSIDMPTTRSPSFFLNEQLAASVGVQTDAEYDRAATGNLSNKPTTVVYALNSLTVSPFFQFRLAQWRGPRGDWPIFSGRELPRTLFVLTPIQYQRQFTGNFLIFPFSQSPPATTPPTISGQFTVHAPTASSVFYKAGLRHEFNGTGLHNGFNGAAWDFFDKGSYAEAGPEIGTLYDNLQSVTLTSDGVTPPPCTANSSTTIAACFAGYANPKSPTHVAGFQIDSTTALVGITTQNDHTAGIYWDIHLQKQLLKSKAGQDAAASGKGAGKMGINWSLDSKADWFSPRSSAHALNTQTQFAVPVSIALNFPVFRNFSFSPTYTGFWYASQVTGQGININTFQIAAKWYFARDASVPALRQAYFSGPAFADQTSTAKIK
jgi:hypothetical protein